MRNSWIQWVIYALLLALGLGLVVWVFADQDLEGLADDLAGTKWEWMFLSFILTLGGHWVRAMRWSLLVKGKGDQPISSAKTFVALMSGYFVNMGVPRLGEVTRCVSLHRLTGIPVLTIAGTVVVERVVDMLCLALVLLGTSLAASGDIALFFREQIWSALEGKLAGKELWLAIGLGILLLGGLGVFAFLRMRTGKVWLKKLQSQAGKMKDGLLSLIYLPGKAWFLLYTLVIWLSYFSAPFCALYALGLEGENPLLAGFVIFAVGSIARSLPVPAGGLGAYHWFVIQAMLVLGYTESEGLALGTLNFAVQTLFYVVLGIVAFIFLGIWGRERLSA